MTAFRRVLILAANVHDGAGGEFFRGDKPVLPADVADLFIARGMASLIGDLTPAEAKQAAISSDDDRRLTEYKQRAEAVMKKHDSLPKADRLYVHEHQALPTPVAPIQPETTDDTVVPIKRQKRRKE